MDTLHHGNSRGVPVTVGQTDCVFIVFSLCVCADKQRAEMTQQHTEWSRQTTQRHMQQIEDLQAQLQAHTQMMALQQVCTPRAERTAQRQSRCVHTQAHYVVLYLIYLFILFILLSSLTSAKNSTAALREARATVKS